MTTKAQGNKKITTRKISATNNKVLVRTCSLCFFKAYRQPFWKILVGTSTSTQDSSYEQTDIKKNNDNNKKISKIINKKN